MLFKIWIILHFRHLGQFLDPEFLGGLLSLFALVTHVELSFIEFLKVCETIKAICSRQRDGTHPLSVGGEEYELNLIVSNTISYLSKCTLAPALGLLWS